MKTEKSKLEAQSEQLDIPVFSGSAIQCFECKETKNLIKDTVYRNTHWCKKHYKERHAIISDFIHHAVTGQ